MGKINKEHFRETNCFFGTSWTIYQIFGFFINYLVQIGLGLCLISFGSKFSNVSY